MKLVKYLADCEVAARRKCAELIKSGIVSVNNKTIKNPLFEIDAENDIIKVEGKIIKKSKKNIQKLYILFYKPEKCITSVSDDKGRTTVMDYLQKIRGWKTLYPVGRLDYDTEGLLILTNDGDMLKKSSIHQIK